MNSSRIRLIFTESCLRQEFATFTPNIVVSLFIRYELDRWSQDLKANFNLKCCLLGTAKLTENANPNKYSNSGYRIGFDSLPFFSIPNFD